jgi:hypothetical protein
VKRLSSQAQISNIVPPVKVDAGTKRDLIVVLYKSLEPIRGYGRLHKAAKQFQDILERDYKITLGYTFTDGGTSSIHDIWDNEFQSDIERYDALGKVVDNSDELIKAELKGYYTHKLQVKSRPKGEYLLKTDIKDNLSNKKINMEKLIEKISKISIEN